MIIPEKTRIRGPVRARASSRPASRTSISPLVDEATKTDAVNGDGDSAEYLDANNRLVDELERILEGDFADVDDDGEAEIGHVDGDFPLAEQSAGFEEEPPIDEPAGSFDFDPPASGSDRPEASPSFWSAAEADFDDPPPVEQARQDRAAIGRFTFATIALMIVAGGAYAYMQLSGEPIVPLDGSAVAATPAAPEEATPLPDPTEPVAPETGEPTVAEAVPADALQPRMVRTIDITPNVVPTGNDPAPVGAVAETGAAPADDGLGGPLVDPGDAGPNATPAEATPAPLETAVTEPLPPATPEPITTAAVPTETMITTAGANLRAGPNDETEILAALPAGTEVELLGCAGWCEVTYQGLDGFIWNELLGTEPVAPEPTPVAVAPVTAEPVEATPAADPAATNAAGRTLATVNTWVNMRAGPDNDTAVITTVPAGAEVELVGCDPWCEVYYQGTHGWIWRDFVDQQTP